MIVNYLHVESVTTPPNKAYSPLVIDTDTVLARSRLSQPFQTIGRRDAEIIQASGSPQRAYCDAITHRGARERFERVVVRLLEST